MPTIRQCKDATDRIQVVELWRNVFGYETAHNERNLAISKKIATNDGLGSSLVQHAEKALAELGCMKVKLLLLSTNEATAAFYKSIGYKVEPRLSMGKLL